MASVQADLVLSIDEALSAVEALGAEIDAVTANVVVEVGADVSEAEAAVDGLSAETVEVPVDADTDPAQSEIDSLEADDVVVPVDADVSDAEAEIDSIEAEDVEFTVSADTAQAEESISGLSDQVEGLGQSGGVAAQGVGALNTAFAGASTSGIAAATGYAAIGTALVGVISSAAEADGVLATTTQTIANMGAGTGVTIEGVQELAAGLLETAGVSDEATIAAAGLLARYQTLNNEVGEGNDIFDRTLLLGADVATVLGTDITSAADFLGKAIANPEAGVGRLARRFPQLTTAVQENIISLQQSGDLLGAQKLLLDTLEGSVEGVAAAYGDSLAGQLDIAQEQMGELAEAAGGVLAPAVFDLVEDFTNLAAAGSTAFGWADGAIQSITGVEGAVGNLGDVFVTLLENLNPIGLALNVVEGLFGEFSASIGDITVFERMGFDVAELRRQKAGLVEEEPAFITALQDAADAASEQASSVDELAAAYATGGPTISDAISNVESNLNTFGQTLDSATDARLVLDNLDQMIGAFQNFTTNLETIGQTSTEVRDVLAVINPEIAGGLAQALAEGNPALIRQFRDRIREIERFGGDAVELFGGTAEDSVEAYEREIRNLEPVTRRNTRDAIGVVRGERSSAEDAARNLGEGMSRGTERGSDGMRPAARGNTSAAITGVREQTGAALGAGQAIGSAFTSGMVSGIAQGIPAVAAAARNAVQAAVNAANAQAGIASPSKVFEEMGLAMGEGMALGLVDSQSLVAAASSMLSASAAYGAGGGGTTYEGSTVSVMVDARGASDPQAVADATAEAVDAAMFKAAVVGNRRRR